MVDVAGDGYWGAHPGANDSGDLENAVKAFKAVADGVPDLDVLGGFGRHIVDSDMAGLASGGRSRSGLDLANAPQPGIHADTV